MTLPAPLVLRFRSRTAEDIVESDEARTERKNRPQLPQREGDVRARERRALRIDAADTTVDYSESSVRV